MIASLRGTVIARGLDHAVIECAGVGYHCSATPRMLAELSVGEEAFVLTTLVVREDSQTLYAFPSGAHRDMFHALQTVSSVGARSALRILSVLEPEEIERAVASGDAKALQRAPGVGKRVADRLIADLKGKLAVPRPEQLDGAAEGSGQEAAGADAGIQATVVEGLVGLGFPEAAAESAVTRALAAAAAGQPTADPAPGAKQTSVRVATDPAALLRASLALLGARG